MTKFKYILTLLPAALLLAGCHSDEVIPDTDPEEIPEGTGGGGVIGLYVLCEGNYGSGNSTLDYYDYTTGEYFSDIYTKQNPDAVMGLGDAANDMAIHGGRLFLVMSGSHKVEVLDAYTARRQGQVNVSSPRCVAFRGNDVFVSSYVNASGYAYGSIVRFDASTLAVKGELKVGLGPEEMVVIGDSLYVANSCNYSAGIFDSTVSVVALTDSTMTAIGSIDTGAPNLHHLRADSFGNLWASSRGDYGVAPSCLVRLQRDAAGNYAKAETVDTPCANLALGNNMLYFIGQTYDANWNATYSYNQLRPTPAGYEAVSGSFLSDTSFIQAPYALAVQPKNGDIFVTDAKNYMESGTLYCFSAGGNLKWQARTGTIPGHIAFLLPQ